MTQKDNDAYNAQIAALEKRLEREKKARRSAETIAEEGLRELYNKNDQLKLLNAVARCITESDSSDHILKEVCSLLGTYLHFDIGRVCILNPRLRDLMHGPLWYDSGHIARFDEFRAEIDNAFKTEPVAAGNSIEPITAHMTGRLHDLGLEAILERYTLSGYLSIPLLIYGEIAAALEFFGTRKFSHHTDLDPLLRQIASQLSVHLERELIRQQTRIDLSRDLLTGLANRRYIHELIDQILSTERSNKTFHTALIVLGYDNFRHLNDTFGHDIGDGIIQEGAARIKKFLASLPPHYNTTTGRVAGDEFAIIIQGVVDSHLIEQVAEQLLLALCVPYQSFDYPFRCTASAGLLHFEASTSTSFQVFSDVDTALQYAKQKGGSNLTIFSNEMRQTTYRRRIMAASVSRGLSQNEFVLHYQPQISTSNHNLIGFEALIRWRNVDGTLINPVEFLPIADRSGLTVPIGQWVLRNSLNAVARWKEILTRYPQFKMSINISPSHFMTHEFGYECVNLLEEMRVHPSNICLEIIESTILENNPLVLRNFEFLRKNGVSIAIDDFGTGYSSLSYLQKYQPDTIKIDQEFIVHVAENLEKQKIVSAIIELANKLGVTVIAEGVETERDFNFLARLGCEIVQGYFFSKPVTEPEALQMLRQNAEKPFRSNDDH